MTFPALPGRWINLGDGLDLLALHRHRPWLATLRSTAHSRHHRLERHDLDTATSLDLLDAPAAITELAWHGDRLVTEITAPSPHLAVIDADGHGLLDEVWLPPDRTVRAIAPVGAGLDVWACSATAHRWDGVRFRRQSSGDDATSRGTAITPHQPAWHPDGHTVAIFTQPHNTRRWSLDLVDREGRRTSTALPETIEDPTDITLAWSGPDTLTLLDRGEPSQVTVWSLTPSTGALHRFNDDFPGDRYVDGGWLSDDHTRVAINLVDGFWPDNCDLTVLDLLTGARTTLTRPGDGTTRGTNLDTRWLDERTVLSLEITEASPVGRLHLKLWDAVQGHRATYAVEGVAVGARARVVGVTSGRVLLVTAQWPQRLFLSDALVGDAATTRAPRERG